MPIDNDCSQSRSSERRPGILLSGSGGEGRGRGFPRAFTMTAAAMSYVATSGIFAFPLKVQGFALGLGSKFTPRAQKCLERDTCIQYGLRNKKEIFAAPNCKRISSSSRYTAFNSRRISTRRQAAQGDAEFVTLSGAADKNVSQERDRELSHAESDRIRAADRKGEEEQSVEEVDRMLAAHRAQGGLPNHLAIIMDGNRRFAKARGQPASFGHLQGKHRLVQVIQWVMVELAIPHLTVYALSVDNLHKRPPVELAYLAELMASGLEELASHPTLVDKRIHVKVAGCLEGLPARLQQAAAHVQEESTRIVDGKPGGVLTVCIGYSGRSEILNACKTLAADVSTGRLASEDVTEAALEQRMWTAGSPHPDLVIRTSGEARLSNFMLWQMAYSELVFVDETWPELDAAVLLRALREFAQRARRFGS